MFGEGQDFGRSSRAVGGVSGVNDFDDFCVCEFFAEMVSKDFAAGAGVEDDDFVHGGYYITSDKKHDGHACCWRRLAYNGVWFVGVGVCGVCRRPRGDTIKRHSR